PIYADNCVVGLVVFELTDASYPLGSSLVIPDNAVANSMNTLTIRPATGVNVTVSGNINGALVDLSGARYVTIDGIALTGDPTLTIENTSTGSSANAVRFSGAAYSTVKRAHLLGASLITGTSTTAGAVVAFHGSAAAVNMNDTLANNRIAASTNGLPTRAILGYAPTSPLNTGITITGNQVQDYHSSSGSYVVRGIYLTGGLAGWT